MRPNAIMQNADLNGIAKMAYGNGLLEGKSGGAGYLGLIDGKVVKLATHSSERSEYTRKDFNAMRDVGNELRKKLCSLAEEASPTDDKFMGKIRKMLGCKVGANEKEFTSGAEPSDKDLLSRSTVAKVLKAIEKQSGQKLEWRSGKGASLSSKTESTGYGNVKEAVTKKITKETIAENWAMLDDPKKLEQLAKDVVNGKLAKFVKGLTGIELLNAKTAQNAHLGYDLKNGTFSVLKYDSYSDLPEAQSTFYQWCDGNAIAHVGKHTRKMLDALRGHFATKRNALCEAFKEQVEGGGQRAEGALKELEAKRKSWATNFNSIINDMNINGEISASQLIGKWDIIESHLARMRDEFVKITGRDIDADVAEKLVKPFDEIEDRG